MTVDELDLGGDVVDLLQQLVDIESVSDNERRIADAVEMALRGFDHLEVTRNGDAVVARTALGRDTRVVLAGHLDTVPVAGNLPSIRAEVDGVDAIIGRGSCDMKGGLAVQLSLVAALSEPRSDITWICYDHEEVGAEYSGLGRLVRDHPDLLTGDFAVLGEPSNAQVEGGCQGTMRVQVITGGTAAHSARAWMGSNAIHAAAPILQRLADYQPRVVNIDGLDYREGLNAVSIEGGIAGNVIPDRCVVTVNYRFAPSRSVAEAQEHLAGLFAGFEIVVTDAAAGALPGLDRPIAQDFMAAVGAKPAPKFGWTDVARFAELGIPAVNYAPGNPSKAHADDEFCPVDEVYACRDALLRWLS